MRKIATLLGSLALIISQSTLLVHANPAANLGVLKHKANKLSPVITPAAPTLNSKSYILIDANSGKIIADKSSDQRLPPAR